jgi:hypothetical protein
MRTDFIRMAVLSMSLSIALINSIASFLELIMECLAKNLKITLLLRISSCPSTRPR